ncbi:MAG: VOC family protein [Pseudomonadota bacterium]
MAQTSGIHHLGLAVKNLESTRDFFVLHLGWEESGYDASYPRTAVSDGVVRLTLWQVDHSKNVNEFDMRGNVGLHHLALQIDDEAALQQLAEKLAAVDQVKIEFMPELMGNGPRKHFICYEPGGLRIEFTWPGS